MLLRQLSLVVQVCLVAGGKIIGSFFCYFISIDTLKLVIAGVDYFWQLFIMGIIVILPSDK
ncbi:MAG: hypothetical protein CM15mP45_17280 [Deltaproteobacteria bacterium]|nr:MAG: hypothetical protein CM15mP45_17280 [Deltaproteobacteria bacterium]